MGSWLTKASRRDLSQNSRGLDDGGANIAPGSSYPGQGSLFPPEGEENVHQKKRRNKHKGRSNQEHHEMLKMRKSDPRSIVEDELL